MDKRGSLSARRRARGGTLRRASATVEMAVVTPLLLTVLLGIIEFGYVFMVEQSLTNGTRDACRLAALAGSVSDTEVVSRLATAMQPTGVAINSSMVTITQPTTENPTVTVRVQVPYRQVSLLGVLPSCLAARLLNHSGSSGSYDTAMVGSSCSMRKEGAL